MPATVIHAFTNPQPDGTATNVVRPSDWNSHHLMTLAPSGAEMLGGFSNANGVSFDTNTAGRIVASMALATSLAFGNANGVTFGLDAGTLTASVATAYIPLANSSQYQQSSATSAITALAMNTSERGNYFATGAYTFANSTHSHGAVAGTNVSATSASNGLSLSVAPQTAFQFSNSNGVSFGTNGSTITASHNGLTTAAQSNHSHGITINLTNLNGTTGGNSAGINLSLSAPAQTVQTQGMVSVNGNTGALSLAAGSSLSSSVNGASTTFGLASNITTALQSAGAYLTTAAQSNHSHGNPTLALTNLSGTTASASNGLTISLSAAAGGGGADGYNILGVNGNSVGSAATLQLSNSNNVTFGLAGSTITASASYPTQTVQPAVAQLNGSSGTLSLAVGSSLSASSNGSTISFGLASNITTALQSAGAYLTTAMQSGASANFAATGFTTTTAAGAVVAGTHDTAGLKLAVPAYLTTAQPVGAYLTTARASNDALGLNSALTANGVSMTANSSGLSLNFPAFLTTAMQSQLTSNYMSTAERGNYFYTSNNTFANSTHSHGNPTLALTNLNGTTASASNGLTLSLSAVVPAQTNQTGNLYALGNSTQLSSTGGIDLRSLSFEGAGVASVGVSNGRVLVSVPSGGGAGDGGNVLVAGGSTAASTGTIEFVDSNGLTFGLAGTRITASHNGLTTAAQSNHVHGLSLNLTNISVTANTTNSTGMALSMSVAAPAGVAVAYPGTNGLMSTQNTGTVVFASGAANYGQVSFSKGADGSIYGKAYVATLLQAGNNTVPGYQTSYAPDQMYLNISGYGGLSVGFDTLNGGMVLSGGAGGGGGMGASAGTQSVSTGTLVFSNSNGITFGMSGSSRITASHNGLTTARASNDGIGLNTALTANGVAWTVNSSGLSLNVPAFLTTAAQSGHSHGNPTLALTNLTGTTASGSNGLTLSLSAGAAGVVNQTGPNIAVAGSTITSGDVVFSNANGVTFGMNGSTITASAAGGGGGGVTNTMWFPFNEAVNVMGQQGQGTLHLVPVPTPDIGAATVTFDRLCFPILHSHATNSTGSVTLSVWFGLYTREATNGTKISLQHSTSFSTGYTFSGTANSSVLSGLRLITIPWTSSVAGNRYIVGIASRTTTGGANCTISQLLVSNINSNFSGVLGQATNSSYQWPIGWGQYSATTSGLPGSIAYSQIYGTNSNAMRNPEWYLVNGTA